MASNLVVESPLKMTYNPPGLAVEAMSFDMNSPHSPTMGVTN